MEIQPTEFEGVYELTPKVFEDTLRGGFFMESFKQSELEEAGISVNWIQDNHSKSGKNIIRGLHFQSPPYDQDKLCRVIRGRARVVIVDIRKASETYGQHLKFELSEDNFKQILVPRGFAHGFLTLTDEVEYHYKISNRYSKNHEGGLAWNDPSLNIDWGIEDPIVLDRDQNWTKFSNFKSPF